MKILLCSDFHLHTYKSFGMDAALNIPRRLSDQRRVLKQILTMASEQKVDLVVFNGDLFHQMGEIPTEALNIAVWFFEELRGRGITWTVLRGNHDLTRRIDAGAFHSAVQPFFAPIVSQGVKIFWYDFDSTVDENTIVGNDLVLVHKDIKDVDYGGYYSGDIKDGVNWKTLAANNKFVFFGHIHTPRKLAKNAYIIGAPMQLNFGDSGDRGIWIHDTVTATASFIPLESPKFITVDDPSMIQNDGNYYRLMGADKAADQENVVTVIEPKKFDNKMAATGFNEILSEWVTMNNKSPQILECIKDILGTRESVTNRLFPGRLTHVTVDNFFSFDMAAYDVINGFTLVNGKSDCFSSNGSGKTSLISEAVLWALFGETSKGLKGDDVIRRSQENCCVTLKLLDGSTEYLIVRSRKDGLSVYRGDEELTAGMLREQSQRFLEDELLGFDVTLFKTACLFSQENLLMMTSLSDVEKTTMISRLLGFEDYEILYEKVSEKINKIVSVIESRTKEIDSMQMSLIYKTQALDDKRAEHKRLDDRREQLQAKRTTLLTEVSNMTQQAVQTGDAPPFLGSWKEDITVKQKQLDDLTSHMESLDEHFSKMLHTKSELTGFVSSARAACAGLECESAGIIQAVSNLESLVPGEICDKCGSKISTDARGVFIHEKLQQHMALKSTLAEATKNFDTLNSKLKLVIDEIDSITAEKLEQKKDMKRLEREIGVARQSLADYEAALRIYERQQAARKTEIDTRKAVIDSLNDQLSELDKQQSQNHFDIDHQVKDIQTTEVTIKGRLDKVAECKTEEADLLFWKTAFSPKGVRSVLLDRFCNDFNHWVNVFLSASSGGKMSIVMTPTKQLKSGEERNKIGMDIFMDGRQMKYEALSGGEKRRVDFSLCLGLTEFVSTRFALPAGLLGIVIFDELFSFLDRSAEESIGQVLREEGRKKAVFVISHTPELESYADRVMTVIKEKGISRL